MRLITSEMSEMDEKCIQKQKSITERVLETGKTLEEVMKVISLLGEHLFGDAPIEIKRPETKCLEENIELNAIGAENILGTLRFLADRLF